jgi:uncharacterized protein YjiS (DUF1127 family)
MSAIDNGEILVRHRRRGHAPTTLQRLFAMLRQAALWPARVLKANREQRMLASLSEYELKDIGLTRSDVRDITALPADVSPTDFLATRIHERASVRRA